MGRSLSAWRGRLPTGTGLVGTLSNDTFVTYTGNTSSTVMQLRDFDAWKTPIDTYTVSSELVSHSANDSGTIAFLTEDGDLHILTQGVGAFDVVTAAADFDEGNPTTGQATLAVSADGSEVVVSRAITDPMTINVSPFLQYGPQHVYGYSTADGSKSWDCVPIDKPYREQGYLLGTVSPGTFLWYNASEVGAVSYTFVPAGITTNTSGSTSTYTLVPDPGEIGLTIGVDSFTYMWNQFLFRNSYAPYNYPTTLYMPSGSYTWNSSTVSWATGGSIGVGWNSFSSSWFKYANPNVFDNTQVLTALSSTNYWELHSATGNYYVADNSDQGGRHLELRDSSGAVLDTYSFHMEYYHTLTQCGDAFVIVNSNSNTYQRFTITGDVFTAGAAVSIPNEDADWVEPPGTEDELSVIDPLVVSSWEGQLAMFPRIGIDGS